jgi:hypothetical protein
MIFGIALFIVGMFMLTQNTQSKACWILISVGLVLIATPVMGHDENHEHDSWYAGLMQPDNPTVSCCGLADAWWCDDYYSRDGKAYCKITDDRPDGPLGRPHVDVGTEIEIPERKLKWDRGNPTGHAVVFLSAGGSVFCFVQGGGV